ncbi:MAG: hypothetical protein ACXW10_04640 [Acidimicrobiia bacterium]
MTESRTPAQQGGPGGRPGANRTGNPPLIHRETQAEIETILIEEIGPKIPHTHAGADMPPFTTAQKAAETTTFAKRPREDA